MKKCLLLLITVLLCGCCSNPYYNDAVELTEVLEQTHPDFALDSIPEGYETAKEEYIKAAKSIDDESTFGWATQKYIVSMRDLHTTVYNPNPNKYFLDMDCTIYNNKLYSEENGMRTGNYITAIGNVDIEKIFDIVYSYKTSENEAGNIYNKAVYSLSKDILELSGCVLNNDSAEVNFENDNGGKSNRIIAFKENPIYAEYDEFQTKNDTKNAECRMINDVLYIDINRFQMNNDFQSTIDAASEKIKNGINKVIIDVRHNPGGNIDLIQKVLHSLDMEPPYMGIVKKNSPLSRKILKDGADIGIDISQDASLSMAKQNPDISLVVLTDEYSISCAALFAVCVKDGKLGTVIGQTPISAPNMKGEPLEYVLKNSNLKVHIPCISAIRPDKNADKRQLMPDIVLDEDTDSLDYALEYIHKGK